MNDRSAREVQRAQGTEIAASPYPVADHVINESGPKKRKYHESLEAYPFGVSPADKCRCDDREHGLKDHESVMRDRRRQRIDFRHPLQPQPIQAAKEKILARAE